jgi:uncharacterized membrane protein YqjE
MAELNKDANAASSTGDESLPALVGRLGEDITTFIDTKLSLLKVEIKEDVNAYVSSVMGAVIGAVIVLVGFALLNVAIAFLISSLFEGTRLSQPVKYALGFIITAAVYLIIGAVLLLKMKGRMAKQGLVPERTVKELEKDKQWLKEEL